MTHFQITLAQQVRALVVAPEAAALPLQLWALDESRLGLQTVRRRRITLPGIKPVGRYQHAYDNFYVYGAVAPRTAEGYFEARGALNSGQFQAFLDAFAATYCATFNVLLRDNARFHQSAALTLPSNVALLFQPPDAPELNPCERVWLAVKDHLAWHCFDDLLALQDPLAEFLKVYDASAFQSLIAYPYLTHAIHALAA